MPRVVVEKDRRMIADELAAAVHAEEWERAELRRLRRPTLLRLAASTIPGFVERVAVDV